MADGQKRRNLFGLTRKRVAGSTSMAMVQPQKGIAKTSAASQIKEGAHRRDRQSPDRAWQREAYELAVDVGEAGYVLSLTANTVAGGELVPMIKTGPGEFKEHNDPRITRVDEAFVGPRGGRRELKRRLATHVMIGGEWWLKATAAEVDDGLLWEALSVLELSVDPQGKVWRQEDGVVRTEEDPESYLARGWVSAPEYSGRADSQMRRALPACREIAVHTQAIDAVSKSKLPAGVFYVPIEIEIDGDGDVGIEGNDDTADLDEVEEGEVVDEEDEEGPLGLDEKILLHFTAAVEDRTDQARYSPFLLRGPGEQAGNIKWIDVSRELSKEALELRQAAIARLAKILDVPPEVLEGKGGLNHWTGYNIDADFIAKFVAAIGEIIAEFLTVAYLRPMLVAYEGMSEQDVASIEYQYKTDALEGQPDGAGTARAMWDRGPLSTDAMMKANGYDPVADAAPPEERIERIALDLLVKRPDLAAQLLPKIRGFEDIVVPAAVAGAPGMPSPAPGTPGPAPEDPEAVGPPVPPATPPGGAARLVDRLVAAADGAVERAMERAGSRLCDTVRDPGLKASLRQVDKLAVFTVAGPADLAQIGLDPNQMFTAELARFGPKVRGWVRDHLTSNGMTPAMADNEASLAADALIVSLTGLLIETLHSGCPVGANGCRVPDELVNEAIRDYVRVPAGV